MDSSSMADVPSHQLEMPPWKAVASHIAAFIVALFFVAAGVFHITDPFRMQRMFEQLLVPYQISMPLTLGLGVVDTFAGVLVLVPRFRRWGGWLAAGLSLCYVGYVAINYSTLLGKDCSCFPWIKRSIGPGFFISDGALMLAAVLAALWSRPSIGKRSAAVILGAVAVFAAVSYGAAVTQQTGTKAPDQITVDGKPYSLQHGRVFLFFYDPHCSHCQDAATSMSKLHWKDDVTAIAIPTEDGRFAANFLHDTHFKALTSLDIDVLKTVFPFGDPPYGVALESGREKGPVPHYEGPEPADTLRKLGYVD